jgi:anti-sigma factor RsiW
MSCSPFDLKDYFLKELPNPQRREVEGHLTGCQVCREELDRLHMTQAALFSLRDEEIPQRIAFVSDKVFEPSPLRRWWNAFWGSTARLGFASAAILSAAILVSALTRPAPAPAPNAVAAVSQAEVERQVRASVASAVANAVAEVEVRQSAKTNQLVADLQRSNEEARRGLWLAAEEFDRMQRKAGNSRLAASVLPPLVNDPKAGGEPK